MVARFFSGLVQRKSKDADAASADALKAKSTAVKKYVEVGSVLEQRYRLDAELGRGGMGVVFRARDLGADRDVAIKVLYADQATEQARADLVHEAQATAQLAHPNIIAIYHIGTVETSAAQATPFIVMELARGTSLSEFRGLTFAQIIEIAKQICAALTCAHAQGLVHRDLKPDNVLVEKQGYRFIAKLVDFGLARPRGIADGSTAGTVFYIAPEVIAGQPADIAADLYSLGVVLYEMVTGRVPFSDFDSNSILAQHLKESVAPPSHTRPHVPPALESIILRLLAKDPAERFASARAVSDALDQVAMASALTQTARHNLPQLATRFIGRADEMVQALLLLEAHRLVTLTGAGGIGKTRLALAAGAALADEYPDGVWLVEFAAWSDPRIVPQVVASVLGVREEARRTLLVSLTEFLAEKNLLLIFDHCDPLNAACARLAEALLKTCPAVSILATSNAPLNLTDEKIFDVPPLATQDVGNSDSMRLLIDRITAASPAFKVAAENRPLLENICNRLNGNPLAIELVAARAKGLSLAQIDEGLARRGARRADQQCILPVVIEWSCALLTAQARALFNRLSVFVGGWTRDLAEKYSGLGLLDGMSLLTQLANAALISAPPAHGDQARYRMPATLRSCALENLRAAGEEETARRNHRDGFLMLALQAAAHWYGGQQGMTRKQLEGEYANLLAALDWTIARPQDALLAFRFGGALWQFWSGRAYWRDGVERLEKILALPFTAAQARARVPALIGAGYLVIAQADYATAENLLAQALDLARAANDQRSAAFALCGLGSVAQAHGAFARAEEFFHAGWEEFQAAGNPWETANALHNLGILRMRQQDYFGARTYFLAGLDAFRQLGDQRSVAQVLRNLGLIAYYRRNYAEARAWFEQALAIWRGLHDQFGAANQLYNLGYVALRQGQAEPARGLFAESLKFFQALNQRRFVAHALYGVAGALAAQRQSERAAQLIGAAEILSTAPGPPIETAIGADEDKTWVLSHIQLDESALNAARAVGRAMSMEQAIQRATG